MEENDIYSIRAINNLIDKKISYCDDFKKIKIRGEITNFNGSYNSGHYYFSLKDKNSSISCVMFKLSTKSLDFEPKNGVDVVASGEVSFYKVRGNLQFRVRKMQEAGLGDLYIAFEKLKKKLDKEGLFKDKKAIPQYHHCSIYLKSHKTIWHVLHFYHNHPENIFYILQNGSCLFFDRTFQYHGVMQQFLNFLHF